MTDTDPREPNNLEPEDVAPENAEAAVTEPETSETDTSEPEIPEPKTPKPGVTEPSEIIFPEADDEPEPVAARTGRDVLKTAGIVSGRVVIGAVAVAVLGAVVAAAALVPLPSIRSSAPSTIVSPAPAAQQVVCPGGLLRLSNSQGKGASQASSLGSATVSSSATAGGVDRTALKSSDAETGGSAAAPQILGTPPSASGAKRSLLSGAQSEAISTSEFSGLAASACTSATGDAWLVGGSTATGRTTLIMLANPSEVPATVSLQIFGEDGQVSAPGTTGIVVAAGGQRVISLAGFAPGLVSPVVHVHSRGGQVVANLQQSTTRGLEPGGIDVIGPQTSATKRAVIPGLQVTGTATLQSRLGQDGFSDLETVVRVYVPGTSEVTAKVTVTPEAQGTATPNGKGTAFVATLEPGKVTDLPVDLSTDGGYSVVVDASKPVIAGVRVSTAGSDVVAKSTDFAWLGAAPLLRADALVPVAGGIAPIIHLQNPGNQSVVVTLTAVDGGASDLTATVRPGASALLPAAAGVVYRLSAPTPVYASVSGTTDGGVAGYSVYPAEAGAGSLRVFG